jgi:hypothetical protein
MGGRSLAASAGEIDQQSFSGSSRCPDDYASGFLRLRCSDTARASPALPDRRCTRAAPGRRRAASPRRPDLICPLPLASLAGSGSWVAGRGGSVCRLPFPLCAYPFAHDLLATLLALSRYTDKFTNFTAVLMGVLGSNSRPRRYLFLLCTYGWVVSLYPH